MPSLYVANAVALPLYATGRTSGVVLEVGGGVSAAVPIFEV